MQVDKKNPLRRRAEQELQARIDALGPAALEPATLEATREQLRSLIHELQVYETELEIQNKDLRATQVELERSRDRYADLFDFSPVGYAIFDRHGVIEEINLTAASLLERDRRRLIGYPLLHFVMADDRGAFLDHLRRCRRGQEPQVTTELRVLQRTGGSIPVEFCSIAERGEPASRRYRTAITCIAKRKEAEAALRRARDQLEQRVPERTEELSRTNRELAAANRHKDEFLAMLAHELRNPLAAIANAGEVLHRQQEGREQDDVTARTAEIIRNQTHHFKVLLDDLLDVARAAQGKIILERQIVSLREIFDQAVEAHCGAVRERRLTLTVIVSDESISLHADFTRCVQIVGNLLHNAVKFTPPGGVIELTAKREGREAVIQVRDNGPGISPEFLPRIFEPFAQADQSLARCSGGLGIGLPLVRQLAELHGGRVDAHSPGLGLGSQFTVRLPLAPDAAETADVGCTSAARAPTAASSILVVDDHPDAANSLGLLLGAHGYPVKVVYDGAAALRFAAENHPDVVLLDIGMPGMNGYETARRLRHELGLTGTLLVAVSGYGTEEDRRRSKEAGFDHHLVKPIDLDRLLALIPP